MIFLDIIKISYEVISLAALAGLTVLFLCKKQKKFLWLLLISLSIMIFWRGVYGMITSRYSSIFIFPAIFGVLVFGNFLQKKFDDFFPVKWSRILMGCCLISVVVACLMKTFLFDKSGNNLLYVSKFISDDSKQYSSNVILDSTLNSTRLNYYSGVPAFYLENAADGEGLNEMLLKCYLHNYSQNYDNVYLLCKEKSICSGSLERFGLKLLKSYPVSRKNKKYWSVYRLGRGDVIDFFANIQNDPVPNGDFSKTETVPDVQGKDVVLKNNIFAKDLFLNLNDGYTDRCNAEVGIVDAWDGNALYMKSDKDITVCHQKFFPVQKIGLMFQYKALKKSKFELRIYFYDRNEQLSGVKVADVVYWDKLNSLNDYIIWLTDESDESKSFFKISLRLDYGEVLIDNVCFRGN